ncbi:MAG: PD-(D/E)XK nuclease family protein [Labilithrix sp.]|nr:PD-(D/E)XK nuclease family protein [Labilithrix sp.]
MRPRVGLALGGPVFAGSAEPRGHLGAPAWGPSGLLRDLELRLGLGPVNEVASVRVPRWTARIKAVADASAFYARSFAVDELGTATTLLAWRDALVEAGWDGRVVAGGSDRLRALAALEGHDREPVPPGDADRLARVDRALDDAPARVYETIALAEDAALWPGRWQSIFRKLAHLGTPTASFEHATVGADTGADARSDLGLLQAHLRGARRVGAVRGDGSLLLLRGDTAGDLADLAAALLAERRSEAGADVVVRCLDPWPLETALAKLGLAAQGYAGSSGWRPAMQVLPLAIELAFEPRDPYRVLELLTLSLGPFRGALGARLARAVARQPGVGGKEWQRQRAEVAARLLRRHETLERDKGVTETEAARIAAEIVDERMGLVRTWLEGPAADPRGAARADLATVVDRVREWLRARLRAGEVATYGAAHAQATALAEAITHDAREQLSQEDARQLLDRFARGEDSHALSCEAAGRIAHVDHPALLLAPADRVFIWGFVSGTERRPPRLPWNDDELRALGAAGVGFPEPAALLRLEAQSWRRTVLGARRQIVMIAPRTIKGIATAPHALWDEISARLALDAVGAARLVRDARALLDGGARAQGERLVNVAVHPPLRLPEARGEWTVPASARQSHGSSSDSTTSVTALERIATCPLAWVLEHRAMIRAGAMARVVSGPQLNGRLGHRLVEELHGAGAFDLAEDAFLTRAAELFEDLLRTEGATLLSPGASIERLQLTRQLREAMRALHRYLASSGRRIAAVEEEVTTDSAIGRLHGRLDLRLVDEAGRSAILDLKWGGSSYAKLLAEGRAVQLAVYARAVGRAFASDAAWAPPAGYFALSRGEPLSADDRMKPLREIDGSSLEETLARVEATARAVIDRHDAGSVHVAGTRRALPLLDALGVGDADRDRHFETSGDAACGYCDYDALCGRKWEAVT